MMQDRQWSDWVYTAFYLGLLPFRGAIIVFFVLATICGLFLGPAGGPVLLVLLLVWGIYRSLGPVKFLLLGRPDRCGDRLAGDFCLNPAFAALEPPTRMRNGLPDRRYTLEAAGDDGVMTVLGVDAYSRKKKS